MRKFAMAKYETGKINILHVESAVNSVYFQDIICKIVIDINICNKYCILGTVLTAIDRTLMRELFFPCYMKTDRVNNWNTKGYVDKCLDMF